MKASRKVDTYLTVIFVWVTSELDEDFVHLSKVSTTNKEKVFAEAPQINNAKITAKFG